VGASLRLRPVRWTERQNALVAELSAIDSWRATSDLNFPLATHIGDSWLVLRLNNFPDHPLWTLFQDGGSRELPLVSLRGWV